MADTHVRAKCKTTGAIASLPRRALDLGMFPQWEEVRGPSPKRPKPNVRPKESRSDEPQELTHG